MTDCSDLGSGGLRVGVGKWGGGGGGERMVGGLGGGDKVVGGEGARGRAGEKQEQLRIGFCKLSQTP